MRSLPTLVSVATAATMCGVAAADTLNVPGDFPTLSSAISAAASGDEIVLAPGTYTADGIVIPPALQTLTIRGDTPADPASVTIEGVPGASQPALTSTATALTIEGVTLRSVGEPHILDAAGAPVSIINARLDGDDLILGGIAYTGPLLTLDTVTLVNRANIVTDADTVDISLTDVEIETGAVAFLRFGGGSLTIDGFTGTDAGLVLALDSLESAEFTDWSLSNINDRPVEPLSNADFITLRNVHISAPIDPDLVIDPNPATAFFANDTLVAEDCSFVGFAMPVLRAQGMLQVRRCEFRSNYGDFGVVRTGRDGPNVVVDSIFAENQSRRQGGALAVAGPTSIRGCEFLSNTSGYLGVSSFGQSDGGAIYAGLRFVDIDGNTVQAVDYRFTVEDSRFRDNRSGSPGFASRGGAIAIGSPLIDGLGGADINQCIFERNAATDARAIYSPPAGIGDPATTVTGSLFVGNRNVGSSGRNSSGDITYRGSTIVLNETAEAGFGRGDVVLKSSVVFAPPVRVGVTQAVRSIIIADRPVTNAPGVINLDPLFIRNPHDGGDGWGDDPATPDIDESLNDDFGDLRLRPGSPAIDAGTNDFFTPGDTDLDGNPRLVDDPGIPGFTVDIGAYEFQGTTCLADTNGDGLATPADFTRWIAEFNTGGSLADQNRDGEVTAADFTSWVLNYNRGCP
ncbi:MAG: choice-of-anchor Q domain-containing protein [Planctomycetota bacterium]